MRNLIKCTMIVALAALAATSLAEEKKSAWFDLEKCAMCKALTEHPGLVENMTWEHHGISNGAVSVTTVRGEYIKAFREAQAKMAETGKRLQQGEQLPLCGMCMALGNLMMKGAKMEYIETRHGDLLLMTSDDPNLIAEIQNWAKHTEEEMKKIAECEKHKKEKEAE